MHLQKDVCVLWEDLESQIVHRLFDLPFVLTILWLIWMFYYSQTTEVSFRYSSFKESIETFHSNISDMNHTSNWSKDSVFCIFKKSLTCRSNPPDIEEEFLALSKSGSSNVSGIPHFDQQELFFKHSTNQSFFIFFADSRII